MEAQFMVDLESGVDFGGQNQIVNEQEQNKEVNAGGLTETDSEESLNGPKAEEPEAKEKTVKEKQKGIEESEEESDDIEAPAKKLVKTVI